MNILMWRQIEVDRGIEREREMQSQRWDGQTDRSRDRDRDIERQKQIGVKNGKYRDGQNRGEQG